MSIASASLVGAIAGVWYLRFSRRPQHADLWFVVEQDRWGETREYRVSSRSGKKPHGPKVVSALTRPWTDDDQRRYEEAQGWC